MAAAPITSPIPPFEVEQWMDRYENTPGIINIAESCSSSISIDKLVLLNDQRNLAGQPINYSQRMTYGAIRGSNQLRTNIARLYNPGGEANPSSNGGERGGEDDDDVISPDNVIVTQGAIAANHLIFYSLLCPGDHVICVYPTYQQLYTVPRTLGAEVSLWRMEPPGPEDGSFTQPDLSALEGLIRKDDGEKKQKKTKMLVINNPNSPTGTVMSRSTLQSIAEIARKHDLILFCDEVYSPLYHSLPTSSSSGQQQQPPSALALRYPKTVITSSMSKAWALAGIRVGWLASPSPEILAACCGTRDYTAISVSGLDDQVAAYALSDAVRPKLLERNMEIARRNLRRLEIFIKEFDGTTVRWWARPVAGTTVFLRFYEKKGKGREGGDKEEEEEEPVDDEEFAKDVLDKTGVFFIPGRRCFGEGRDFKGYVRVGIANDEGSFEEALQKLRGYLKGKNLV